MRSFGSVDNVIRVDRRAIRRFSSQLGNPITVSASISKYSFLPYWPTAESTRFCTSPRFGLPEADGSGAGVVWQ